MLDLEDTYYFKSNWDEVQTECEYKGTTYYVSAYPLDQSECDTIVVRVYKNSDYKSEECGNGLWTDTGANVVLGNDELDFEGLTYEESEELEVQLITKLFEVLEKEGVI